MKLKALKGFKDILPDEAALWQDVERVARQIFHRFGYREIRVPILENTGLFARSIGETTDIVEKEMYSFVDRNGKSLTMRPEGTASVLRAFIEHNLHAERPVQKLYTMGPMFRHERPQKGRLRQFHQMSVEALGADQPEIDAEIIAMASMLISELGLDVSLEINSLGCPKCRPNFNQALLDFLAQSKDSLCPIVSGGVTKTPCGYWIVKIRIARNIMSMPPLSWIISALNVPLIFGPWNCVSMLLI